MCSLVDMQRVIGQYANDWFFFLSILLTYSLTSFAIGCLFLCLFVCFFFSFLISGLRMTPCAVSTELPTQMMIMIMMLLMQIDPSNRVDLLSIVENLKIFNYEFGQIVL